MCEVCLRATEDGQKKIVLFMHSSGSSGHPPTSSPSQGLNVALAGPSTPQQSSQSIKPVGSAENLSASGGSARKRSRKDWHIDGKIRKHWNAFTVSELDDQDDREYDKADHCRGP